MIVGLRLLDLFFAGELGERHVRVAPVACQPPPGSRRRTAEGAEGCLGQHPIRRGVVLRRSLALSEAARRALMKHFLGGFPLCRSAEAHTFPRRPGKSDIHIPVVTEMFFGRVKKPTPESFTGKSTCLGCFGESCKKSLMLCFFTETFWQVHLVRLFLLSSRHGW